MSTRNDDHAGENDGRPTNTHRNDVTAMRANLVVMLVLATNGNIAVSMHELFHVLVAVFGASFFSTGLVPFSPCLAGLAATKS